MGLKRGNVRSEDFEWVSNRDLVDSAHLLMGQIDLDRGTTLCADTPRQVRPLPRPTPRGLHHALRGLSSAYAVREDGGVGVGEEDHCWWFSLGADWMSHKIRANGILHRQPANRRPSSRTPPHRS